MVNSKYSLLWKYSFNYIYFKSPIGKALIGKDLSEMISVNTPSGERDFEILKVDYI